MNMAAGKQRKTYHIWTMGCQMNEADSRRLASELEGFGYAAVPEPNQADLVVLNTCVVRQQAENKIYGRLGSLKPLKEKNPDLIVAVMGCFVGIKESPSLRRTYPFVDVFMPPSDTQPIIDFLSASQVEELQRSQRDEALDSCYILPAAEQGKTVSANVSIVLGCSHACTYCIIPYRRGREHSRPPQQVLNEVRALAQQGVKEVILLGQIVDRYGLDLDEDVDLADLLTAMNEVEGLERIRIVTSHPSYMSDKLIDAIAALDKVCPHVELPIQAGSDAMLEAMRRGYTVQEYRELVDKIRARIPDVAINTDIIVGFCGETDEQFKQTYKVVKDLEFTKVHIAKYSPRPQTVAARRLDDDVPAEEKERRRKLLDDLQREILERKSAETLGTTVEVLVEVRQKGRWRGRSPQNRLVFFDDDRDLFGQLVQVRINHAGPYSLVGSAVDRSDETN